MQDQPDTELLPYTNENVYEFLWRFREDIFTKIIENSPQNIFEVFAQFDNFQQEYELAVPTVLYEKKQYLRGDIKVTKNPDYIPSDLKFEIDTRLAVLKMLCDDTVDCVVELGCGYGRRIFELIAILQQPQLTYIAAEYTKSGRRITEKLAQSFFSQIDITVPFVDHNQALFPFIPQDKNVFVYTCHSLEQIHELPEDYFIKLAQSTPHIKGVHIEPCGFQFTSPAKYSFEQVKHHTFIKHNKYNLNMANALKYAEKKGILKIEHVETDFSYEQPENPSSWVYWTKC